MSSLKSADRPGRSRALPPLRHALVDTRVLAVVLWLGAFWLALVTLVFHNDHFGRISPARQIAIYGDLPFRDYFDPGYFLTELASAGLMRLLGDNLLGEALLTTAFIATGTVLVFVLAVRLTGFVSISLMASVIALLLLPRAYDYDKVLFLPLGVLLCWRYVERPSFGRIWAFGAVLVVAALFRYDTGVYLAAAMAAALAVAHAGSWRLLGARTAQLLIAIACLALPFLAFIHYGTGLDDAIDQMITYGRRETARTQLPTLRFTLQPLESVASSANGDVFLTHVVRLAPLAGVVLIVLAVQSRRASREEAAQLASLITICVCLNVFILRDPVGARLGGMAGPVAVLLAWIAHGAWHAGQRTLRVPRRIVVAVFLVLTVWAVSASADWRHRFRRDFVRPSYLATVLETLIESPARLDRIPNRSIVGLVSYLRECTAPTDRVLATWFVPDLYFYAQRGFAARVVALFGRHWSEPRFERRSVEALESQSVPVVVTRTGDEAFRDDYSLLTKHLEEQYRLAGTSDFGDPDIGEGGYSVWVLNDRRSVRGYADGSMPCFQ